MIEVRDDGGWAKAVHLGVLGLLVWWTVRLASGSIQWCVLDLVNLVFHEAGHVILRPLGSTLHLLGGTLFQLAVPAVLVGYFLVRRPDPFAAGVCGWWFGESLVNVATYMADARDLELPLIGGEHDWNELFYRFGALDEGSVAAISSLTRGLGIVVMVAALLCLGALLLPASIRRIASERLHLR